MSYSVSYYNNYPIYSIINASKIITDDFNCDKINCNEITGNNAEFNNLKVNNNTITKNIVVSNYSTLNDVSLNNLTSYNITNTNLISTKDLEVDNNLTVNNNTSIIGDLSVGGNETLTGDLSVNNINSNNINNSNLITTNDLTYSTDYKNCKLYYVNYFNSFWGYATSASYTNNYLYLSLVSGSSTISGYTRTYKKYFVYKCVKDTNNFYFDEIELDNNSLVYNIYSKKLYFVNDVNGTKYMKCLSIGQGTYRDYGLGEYGEIFNDYENNKCYDYSHAEGRETQALSSYSHAEGHQTKADGISSHAEGYKCEANSYCSHAEGYNTKANSYYSHVEGYETETKKYYTHAGGLGTTADQECQTAIGKYNIKNNTNSLFSIGNGTDDNNRSDAFNVYQNGNCNINNDLSVNNDLTVNNDTTTNNLMVSNDLTVNNDLNVSGDFNINGSITTNNLTVNNDLTLTNNIIYDNDYKNNRILIISNYFNGNDTTNINTQDKYYLCISTNGSYTQNKIYQSLTLSPLSTTEITPEDFLIIFVEIDKRYFIYFNNNWSCINNGKFLINNVLKNSIIFNDNTNNYTNGVYNTIFGYNNSVSNGNAHDIIVGGSSNSISGDAKNSLVMGTNNKLPSASYSCFIIGSQNEITSYMDRSIIYGFQNKNNNGDSLDCLLGGYQNTIHDCDTSIISGTGNNYKSVRNSLLFGQSNTSTASNASHNNIFGGNNNNIDTITSTNNIISGNSNTLQTNNTSNSIISGISNVIDGLNNSIVSGNTNTNLNLNNSLIYGNNNISSSTSSSENNLLGGYNNNINTITSTNNIISGNTNTLQTNNSSNSIISGSSNIIDGLTNSLIIGNNNTNYTSNLNNICILGENNKVRDNNEFVCGKYNNYMSGRFTFQVGGGSSDSKRKNLLEVYQSGRTRLRELCLVDYYLDHQIITHDGYCKYYINNGQGDKEYYALTHCLIDITDDYGVFWSAPIYLPASTSSTLALSRIDVKINNFYYYFYCLSYDETNKSSGVCLTSANWQGESYVKANALKYNNGQNYQVFQDQYYNNAYPMIQFPGVKMYMYYMQPYYD